MNPGGSRDDAAAGEPPDDATLLRRHVDGDDEAFGELVRRHRDRLWAVALRTLGDPEEAADAVQDALLSAFRRAETFRGDARVTTWLHRIVVNACLDRARRRAAARSVPLDASEDRLPLLTTRDSDAAERRELRLDVQAALATLPVEQRAALVLVDMAGWSVADAAKILGCAEGTVKSRCARGRAKLLPHLRHLREGAGREESGREESGEPGNAAPPVPVPPSVQGGKPVQGDKPVRGAKAAEGEGGR